MAACTHYYGDRYYGLRPLPPKADDSLKLVREAANRGLIDNPSNLVGSRVWLFHGMRDDIVPLQVMETLRRLYDNLGVQEPKLQFYRNQNETPANHGIPVSWFTGESRFPVRSRGQHEPPFVIQCGYEAAEMLLSHLYQEPFKPAPMIPIGTGH
jgi:hypothetical protein